MKTPDVIDIVAAALVEGGYDGLFNGELECGCVIGDLEPCGEMRSDCAAGWNSPCDCGDHDFHITSLRPSKAVDS